MLRTNSVILVLGFAILALLLSVTPAMARSNKDIGSVKIQVSPRQAYVFVDGNAIRDGSQTIVLSPGKHTIGVDNYGYIPQTRTVNVVAGQTIRLQVALREAGEKVSGPFGDIELKGHPRAAVLLNGDTPAYFVGHVDEFDNNRIWHQWLLVKPGDYRVMVTQRGKTIWSGPVNVSAGQRVVVYLNHSGRIAAKNFSRGLSLGPQPRFDAGVASAMVPIAPVTAQFAASPTQTVCGQSVALNWRTMDAADTSITNLGNVPISGDRTVRPTRTTTYELVAKGPGGEVKQSATIDVNTQPTATLAFSEPEVKYEKVGDKVVEQGSATLHWSTSNGDKVIIQPLGSVATSGSENVEAKPSQTGTGPVNQDVTYTLSVANACGGTAMRTATLHIVGSINPPPPVTLASLFYPTNYPEPRYSRVGLVFSQEQVLAKAAAAFKNNEQYEPQNTLVVVGHADVRGPANYNLALSERRANLVKRYLVSQGIAADKIETRAEGQDRQLTEEQVQKLQSHDEQLAQKWMVNRKKATWLAYNRRVDIILEPAGQTSAMVYPNDAPGARILWQRPEPSLRAVELASQARHGNEVAQTQKAGS
jgi:OmpA family/PEGA domain